MYGTQLNWSDAQKLRQFCEDNGLQYIATTESCAGLWDRSVAIHKGSGETLHYDIDEDQDIMVNEHTIRKAKSLAEIIEYLDAAAFFPDALTIES
ncbi:MAG: hypothetical protein HC843_04665 [Sphingomonadales bacterium]|nr:hypothetical protein [Sphingomonadales bacterium]